MKTIKENEYFVVGETIFQYVIVEGKHKLIPTKKVVKKVFIPPSELEVITYFTKNGYTDESARKFYNYYNPEWKDSNEKLVKNWAQKARGIWFKEANKIILPKLAPTQPKKEGEFLF